MEKLKFELQHADRALGLGSGSEHKQEDFGKYLDSLFREMGGKKIKGLEIEKTPTDKTIIQVASNAVDEFLAELVRQKQHYIPLDNMHVFRPNGVEEYTHGRTREGAHSSVWGSIIVDRMPSDIDFALRVFHELFHAKSYIVLQETKYKKEGERKIEEYRSGFSVTTRDGKTTYFKDLGEAIVALMTRRFLDEKIYHSDIFLKELGNQKHPPYISRQEEVQKLEHLINQLWEQNKERFQTKEEIKNLFIDAQVNGRLLNVGRLVEKTFGKGSFRKLGSGEKIY